MRSPPSSYVCYLEKLVLFSKDGHAKCFYWHNSTSSLPVKIDAKPFDQFFPEASEVDFARQSVFSGCSFKLDYLTNPSFFEDFGFVEKIKMSDRVKTGDELFLVGYPYFNVNGKSKYPLFLLI